MENKTDLMRFRDKDTRDETALNWMQDKSIELHDLHIFESNYEYHLYVIYSDK